MDPSGKFATLLSTSKHFSDITAHRYIQLNCQDLGLKYIRGLSADMDDLAKTLYTPRTICGISTASAA